MKPDKILPRDRRIHRRGKAGKNGCGAEPARDENKARVSGRVVREVFVVAASAMGKHFIELLTPKQSAADLEAEFAKFEERYRLFLERDYVVSITDNPMGNLSYTGPEVIEALGLPVSAENLVLHLNTFHRKTGERYDSGREQNEQDLDIFLQHALALGARYLLCVSGDGSERLPRLRPEDIGCDPERIRTVTSVQLIEYINRAYPGKFIMGAAFNQYEPAVEELAKLERKLAAGASFIITQPVAMDERSDPRLGLANENLRAMLRRADEAGVQVSLEAWISQKLAYLMPECVGHDIDFGAFDPWANLEAMREAHPGRRLYLSMVFSRQTLDRVEGLL